MSRYFQALGIGVVAAAAFGWQAFVRSVQVPASSTTSEASSSPVASPPEGGYPASEHARHILASEGSRAVYSVPAVGTAAPAGSYATRWNESQPAAFAAFREWTETYRAAPESERAGLVATGVVLAQARRAAMTEFIKHQPRAAFELAVPAEVRGLLPQEVTEQLESRVAGTGDLSVTIVDNPIEGSEGFAEETRREVQLEGERYVAHVYGRRAGQATEYGASLHGIALDGHLALHENPVRWLEPGEAPAGPARSFAELAAGVFVEGEGAATPYIALAQVHGASLAVHDPQDIPIVENWFAEAEDVPGPRPPILYSGTQTGPHAYDPSVPTSWTTGTKRILVLPIDFSDRPGWPVSVPDGSVPITPQMLRDRFATQVAPFFSAVSYGKASLVVTVADKVYRAREPAAVYVEESDVGLLHRDILTAASADWNAANYDVVMLVFSDLSDFPDPWEGLFQFKGGAEVGGSRIWINGWPSWDVLAHELGHTYGLWHAHALPTRADPFDESNDVVEYGDRFDVMGSGESPANHFNEVFKHRLGWLPQAAVREVTQSGVYRVYRSDAAEPRPGQIAAIKMPVRNGVSYSVGYQVPPIAAGTQMSEGAYIRQHEVNGDTLLLDLSRETPSSDAALGVGRTISNTVLGFTFTTLRKGVDDGRAYLDMEIQLSQGALPVRSWGMSAFGPATVPWDLAGKVIEQVVAAGYGTVALDSEGVVWTWDDWFSTFTPFSDRVQRIFASSTGARHVGGISDLVATFFDDVPSVFRTGMPLGGLSAVTRVSLGESHVLALHEEGFVVSWGESATGATDVPEGLFGVVDVAATRDGSCALRSDGSAVVWGNLRPPPAAIGRILAISPTANSIVALRWDGTVAEWGRGSGWTSYASLGSDLRSIDAAPSGGWLGLRENGKVVSWTSTVPAEPRFVVPPDLPPVTAITIGLSGAAAIVNRGAPVVTVQPNDRLVSERTSVKFTAFGVGTGKLSYRWQRLKPGFLSWRDLTTTENFRGAYSHTLQVSAVPRTQSGEKYRCVIKAADGTTVTSDDAQLLVEGALIGISTQPAGQTVHEHASVTLAVTPYGESPFTYQWFKDGTPLTGRTGPQLTISDVRSRHAGSYTVQVSNGWGSVMSAVAKLVVTSP